MSFDLSQDFRLRVGRCSDCKDFLRSDYPGRWYINRFLCPPCHLRRTGKR